MGNLGDEGGSLLHQDTRAFGVASATLPTVSLTHDDDAAAAAHVGFAEASGAPQTTRRQPSMCIGLVRSGRTPAVIPTPSGAGGYVMGMKSVTDREPRAGRAPRVANCGRQAEGSRR
jgi:hypothetical protein